MKWFNKEHRNIFLKQIKEDAALNKEERYVLKYAPLAFKHARSINTEEGRSGVLNVQDIEQIAFMALMEAWNAVSWDKIEDSEQKEKTLINYLSSNISGRIKRHLLREATGVNIPQSFITKIRQEMIADSLFGNWMYSFRIDDGNVKTYGMKSYIDTIEWTPDSSSWDNDNLNDLLTDIMQPLRQEERDVLSYSFGLYEKLSAKKIGDRIGKSQFAVEKIKQRAITKLCTEENQVILKDFL